MELPLELPLELPSALEQRASGLPASEAPSGAAGPFERVSPQVLVVAPVWVAGALAPPALAEEQRQRS